MSIVMVQGTPQQRAGNARCGGGEHSKPKVHHTLGRGLCSRVWQHPVGPPLKPLARGYPMVTRGYRLLTLLFANRAEALATAPRLSHTLAKGQRGNCGRVAALDTADG